MRRLEEDADALFSTRPSKKDLNVLLARHAETLKVLRDAALRPPQWEGLSRDLHALEKAYDKAGEELLATDRERARLGRLQGVLPLVAQRVTAARALAALGSLPELAPDASARRAAAMERRRDAGARARAAERELTRRRARLDELTVDDALLPRASGDGRVHARASGVAQDGERRAGLSAQAAALARAWRGGDHGDRRRRTTRSARAAGGVPGRSGRRSSRRCGRPPRRPMTRGGRPSGRDRRSTRCPALRSAPLAAAIRAGRAAGGVDERIARALAEEAAARREAEAQCARMVPRVPDAEALGRLPVPDREAVAELLGLWSTRSRPRGSWPPRRRRSPTRSSGCAASATRSRPTRAAVAHRAQRRPHDPRERWSGCDGDRRRGRAEPSAYEHASPPPTPSRTPVSCTPPTSRAWSTSSTASRPSPMTRATSSTGASATRRCWRRRRGHGRTRRRRKHAPTTPFVPSPAQAGAWLAAREAVLAHLAAAAAAARDAASPPRCATSTRPRFAGSSATRRRTGRRPAARARRAGRRAAGRPARTGRAGRARRRRRRADRRRAAGRRGGARRAAARRDEWLGQWTSLRDAYGLAASLAPDDALAAVRALEQAARDREPLEALRPRSPPSTHAAPRRGGAGRGRRPVSPDALGRRRRRDLHRRAAAARAAAAERDALAAAIAELDAEHAEATAIAAEADEELADLRAAAGAEDDEDLVRRERAVARAEELRAELRRSTQTSPARAARRPTR